MSISVGPTFLLLAAMAATQRPDPTTVVGSNVACADCRIDLQSVARLGTLDGPGIITGTLRAIVADREGRYWIATEGDLPRIFYSRGLFVRALGGRGRGPGEFQKSTDIVPLPGDSMLIVDPVSRRASVIGPDLRFARAIQLPSGQLLKTVPLNWPRSVLVNAIFQDPNSVGWPLHLVDMSTVTATVAKSFGTNKGVLKPGRAADLLLRLTEPQSGRVWAVDVTRYQIQQWDDRGDLVNTLVRRAEWFPSTSNYYALNRSNPPPPSITGVTVDTAGRLWVYARIARERWRDAWVGIPDIPVGPDGRYHGPAAGYFPSIEKLYRTRIEVIDLRTRRLLTSAFADFLVMATLPDGQVASWSENSDGAPIVSVYKVVLRQPQGSTVR